MVARTTATAILALSLVLAPGAALAAETPPATLPAGVRAAVEVSAMDLDVVATKDGRAVKYRRIAGVVSGR